MTPFDSATAMLAALGSDQVAPEELLALHIERIERLNPKLNAIVTRAGPNDERARARARGPLTGLPVTIKDTIEVAGLPTTAGDPARAGARAAADAPAAAAELDAGAVLLGKTNVPPYAGDWQADNRLFGRTVNPWDPERTPGGSTGGGAAALAAGLTALELGSDIGGSIRVPAAFCGVFGHRPSEPLVPRTGQMPASEAMCVIGPLARSAQDLELVLEIIATEPLPPPRGASLSDLRVAVLPWVDWLPVDPDIAAALEALAARLPHARTAQPGGFDLWAHEEAFAALLAAITFAGLDGEGRAAAEAALRSAPDPITPSVLRGLRASRPEVEQLLAGRTAWQELWAAFFKDFDLLLTPVTIVNAFPHTGGSFPRRRIQVDGHDEPYKRLEVYPGLAALSGLPATAFPTGWLSREGLPIGLQVMGPAMEDLKPIRFALLAERELGCQFEAPPSFG